MLVCQGAGERWYADLLLNPTGVTEAVVAFQNGGKVRTLRTEWVPYDLSEHNGQTLRIRSGDAVRFAPATLMLEGMPIDSIYTFTNAGTVTVSSGANSVQIEVVEGVFPEPGPACMPERERIWTFFGMPFNVVYETDSTIDLAVLESQASSPLSSAFSSPPITNNPQRITALSLTAHATLGEHWLVSRLYEDGPILDSVRINTFWVGSILNGYASVVERHEDMEVWEMSLTAKQLPAGASIVIETIVAGVVFADTFDTSRTLTATDFNEQGELVYRLVLPSEVQHSVCHTVKLYQDGELIGEAYAAGESVPGI